MKRNGEKRKQIVYGIFLMLLTVLFCALVYKAQLQDQTDEAIVCTLKVLNKAAQNGKTELSAKSPVLSEEFECGVPELKKLLIEITGETLASGSTLLVTLTDADAKETYYSQKIKVSEAAKQGSKSYLTLQLDGTMTDSEGKTLLLTIRLNNAQDTCLFLTSNEKEGMVSAFNGNTEDCRNIIYSLHYASVAALKPLFMLFCGALLFFLALSYALIVCKRLPVQKFYIPLAFFLGLLFQGLIAANGVPDESVHMDTAYKYSNKLLGIADTGNDGTIYKRKCDAVLSDMLANDVETNAYYQIMAHTFEPVGDTELVEVSYADSSNLVPAVIYLPAAAGLCIGRLFHASAMLTYQLARICNLLAFVLLTGLAIHLIPFGKNLLGCLGFLPITLQQAASVSYDAMINAAAFLFAALCFFFRYGKRPKKKWAWVLWIASGILVALSKGGVYLPLLLLPAALFFRKPDSQKKTGKQMLKAAAFICGGIAVMICLAVKILPTVQNILSSLPQNAKGEELYSLSYVLKHPLKVVYLCWNTFVRSSGTYFRGMLGGILGWYNLKPDWLFVIVFFVCLLLFAHAEKDYFWITKKQRIALLGLCGVSVFLIMLSMLFGYTPLSAASISGLQGRYFLPLCPVLFMTASTSMARVKAAQRKTVWMTFFTAELLLMLEVLTLTV